MRSGGFRTVGLVGADCLSRHADYSTMGRGTAILFGDAGGAASCVAPTMGPRACWRR